MLHSPSRHPFPGTSYPTTPIPGPFLSLQGALAYPLVRQTRTGGLSTYLHHRPVDRIRSQMDPPRNEVSRRWARGTCRRWAIMEVGNLQRRVECQTLHKNGFHGAVYGGHLGKHVPAYGLHGSVWMTNMKRKQWEGIRVGRDEKMW